MYAIFNVDRLLRSVWMKPVRIKRQWVLEEFLHPSTDMRAKLKSTQQYTQIIVLSPFVIL